MTLHATEAPNRGKARKATKIHKGVDVAEGEPSAPPRVTVKSTPTPDGLMDPIQFTATFWPDVRLYDKQAEILYSIRDHKETFVPAGNGLGKDFVAALAALWFFCSRRPARVVTTSVKHDQLNDVLWGELRNFIDTARYNLPIQYNHLKIRQVYQDGRFVAKAEMVGQVVNKGESILGRHLMNDIPRTFLIGDEVSGIDTQVVTNASSWYHRALFIGNCFECRNFWYDGVKGGDKHRLDGSIFRKIIRITALDSPNVQYALREIEAGLTPSNTTLIPGLVTWEQYQERLAFWDKVMQCIGLHAQFYEGADTLMFPPEWLNEAEANAASYTNGKVRRANGIGADTAAGGDNTAWVAVDNHGLIDLLSKKTPDTSVVPGETLAFMKKHGASSGDVMFDLGGGGREHAHRLRRMGYNVRSVGFGESPSSTDVFRRKTMAEASDEKEIRYTYRNRRAEMYWLMRMVIDPSNNLGYCLPKDLLQRKRPDNGPSLRDQLAVIPIRTDDEGRLILPPKNKKDKNDKRETLTQLIGCSPDEADALVLANFARLTKLVAPRIGFFK